MKCYSYDQKDMDKHFNKIIWIFYILGADMNLKQAFPGSLPKLLAEEAEIYIQNKYRSILTLSAGQTR